ncbi:MAG TPA: hypothetical protein VFM21_02440 [Terriglobia bacterium]|nr:hypothetical protein [Terriglobia bacterium]
MAMLVAIWFTPTFAAAQATQGTPPAPTGNGEPKIASNPPEASVAPTPADALRFEESGRTFLQGHNWREADESLARAIELGVGPEAHLLRAQALIAQSKPDEARAEMNSYLGDREVKDLPIDDRMTCIEMEAQLEILTDAKGSAPLLDRPLPEIMKAIPELEGLEPAQSQQPLTSLLKDLGERAVVFFRDFNNTTSVELIEHRFFDRKGKPKSSIKREFQYLLARWPDASHAGLDEYRVEKSEPLGGMSNGLITTRGFASLSILFLPAFQEDSQFKYLGRQPMGGYDSEVIAFAQSPGVARLRSLFGIRDQKPASTLFQGIVWIDRLTHQIVRLRTDLLYPVPKVHLTRETTEVRYAPVKFKKSAAPLWLPSEVVVTVEWRGRLVSNLHYYSDFRLFNVESNWKAKAPKVEPE